MSGDVFMIRNFSYTIRICAGEKEAVSWFAEFKNFMEELMQP
jgi:hypothetical protein